MRKKTHVRRGQNETSQTNLKNRFPLHPLPHPSILAPAPNVVAVKNCFYDRQKPFTELANRQSAYGYQVARQAKAEMFWSSQATFLLQLSCNKMAPLLQCTPEFLRRECKVFLARRRTVCSHYCPWDRRTVSRSPAPSKRREGRRLGFVLRSSGADRFCSHLSSAGNEKTHMCSTRACILYKRTSNNLSIMLWYSFAAAANMVTRRIPTTSYN